MSYLFEQVINLPSLCPPCSIFFSICFSPGTIRPQWISNKIWSTRLQSHELSTPLPLGAILLAIGVNTDTSNQLINVSNRTRSTRLQSHELLTPLPLGAILLAIGVNKDTSNQMINVSNRTRSTRLQFHELSTALHWARSCLLCQADNCDLFINVSNRTPSTRLQSRELSTPLPIAIYWLMPILKARSQFKCFNETKLHNIHFKRSSNE